MGVDQTRPYGKKIRIVVGYGGRKPCARTEKN